MARAHTHGKTVASMKESIRMTRRMAMVHTLGPMDASTVDTGTMGSNMVKESILLVMARPDVEYGQMAEDQCGSMKELQQHGQ